MPSSHATSDRDEAIAFQGALVVIDVNGGLLHQLIAAPIVSDFSHLQKDELLMKAYSRCLISHSHLVTPKVASEVLSLLVFLGGRGRPPATPPLAFASHRV